MNRKYNVTVILKSCLTGKAIWIYQGASKVAMKKAYRRACKRENNMLRRWSRAVARRKANVKRMLSDLTESLPPSADMLPEQKTAARRLLSLADTSYDCYREFWDHVLEERRRYRKDVEIWRKMRERKKT